MVAALGFLRDTLGGLDCLTINEVLVRHETCVILFEPVKPHAFDKWKTMYNVFAERLQIDDSANLFENRMSYTSGHACH